MSWTQNRRVAMMVIVSITILLVAIQAGIRAAPLGGLEVTPAKIIALETIQEFSDGKLCKAILADHTCQDVIVFTNGKIEPYEPDKHGAYFEKTKLSARLQRKLEAANPQDIFPVAVWLTDIDTAKIDKYVKEKLQIDDPKTANPEKLKLYIKEKRLNSKAEYQLKNKQFFAKYANTYKKTETLISGYAPFIIAHLAKEDLEKMVKDAEVVSIDLFNNAAKDDELAYSEPNIGADYTRDTLNLKGSGVAVGVVESGYADKSNAELADRNIIFDVPDLTARTRLSTHATIVSSIIVGKTQGIVPAATLYVAAALTRLEDYQKIEWLIDQGVTLINYSAGYSDTRGEYSAMAKWIDHLGPQHHVHFIKSAGNLKNSSYLITDPGMAYNAVVVGSTYEHDSPGEPYWTDDTLSTYSCYGEITGGYKPDLTAPGEGINAAGYVNYSGTSFAAPHVTSVLTQLLNYRSNLGVNNSLLKAICAAGTNHHTAADYGNYGLSPYYSNQEGAGVIDAKAVYQIVANSTYADLELTETQFPYEITFNVSAINRPVRVSLAWLKQNTITAASHPGAAVTERLLSDLDLVVYGPNGNLIAHSLSGVNNLELVQFNPTVTGTYRIRVNGYAVQNSTEQVSLAWYQQP